MLPPERTSLARRALRLLPDGPDPELVADLALLAGDTARAVRCLALSAERARDRGALETAAGRLEHAVRLSAAGSDAPAREAGAVARVRERLAEVRALAGDVAGAVALARPALRELEARRGDDVAGRVGDLELALARALLAAGATGRARDHADRALAAADQAGDDARRIRAVVLAAQTEAARERLAQAAWLARDALSHTASEALPEARCEALEVVGRCLRVHDVAAAERAFESALAVAEEHGLSLWRARALHELGTIDLFDSMATRRLEAARRTAVEAGAPALAAVVDLHLASALVAGGDQREGGPVAHRAVALAERLGLSTLPAALTVLARSHAQRGDRAGAEAVAARARTAAPGDHGVEAGLLSHVATMLALHEADPAAARAALDRAAVLLRGLPGHHDPHRGLWALLCTLDGDGAAERAEAAAAAGSDTRFNRALLRAAGAVVLGRDGDGAGADDAFAAAMADLGGYVRGAWTVHVTQWLVAPAARVDGWGEPGDWLREALRWFAEHEYAALAASSRRMLRAAGERVPRAGRGSSTVPEELLSLGVTSREVDVLRLVVAGRTNREIAGSLVLSPKTVEKHVASLLLKTGEPDRLRLRARFPVVPR